VLIGLDKLVDNGHGDLLVARFHSRLGRIAPLRLIKDPFPDNPALDVAISRALLERVGGGELPETLRLGRPAAWVAFGKRDAISPAYPRAVARAREVGFGAALRLAGGRAAVFHEGTVAIAHAVAEEDARSGVHDRFRETADLVTQALRALGVDARVGEVPGEYCPGGYSVNARGQTKLAGIGQRLIRGGAHIGGVIVVSRADRVKAALTPVYEELGLDWRPDTAGAIEDEIALNWEAAMAAIKAGYEERYEVEEAALDEDTLDLAHRLKPEHEAEG
jgi:octanoyl-[GcvH]:protein N-octanoyltransferase